MVGSCESCGKPRGRVSFSGAVCVTCSWRGNKNGWCGCGAALYETGCKAPLTRQREQHRAGTPGRPRLKRCPFCGGEAAFIDHPDGGAEVRCADPVCAVTPSTSIAADVAGDRLSLAASNWNRRIGR